MSETRRVVALVPLRAPATCADWERAASLCSQTIDGLLSAGDNICVILVCHQPPANLQPSERLRIVTLDRLVPTTTAEMMEDKALKLERALEEASAFLPAWIMKVDADDLVSGTFLRSLAEHIYSNYAIVENGYIWASESNWFRIRSQFHLYCGTCYAVYTESAGNRLIDKNSHLVLMRPHHTIGQWMSENCEQVFKYRDPAVIYRVGYGGNAVYRPEAPPRFLINRNTIKRLLSLRRVRKKHKEDFHMVEER